MARREVTITIDAEGRDQGKIFVIRELSAMQAEAWATRFLLCLARSGIDIPDDVLARGMAGVASVGVQALGGLRWEDAKPLLDEMMSCVRIMPSAKNPAIVRPVIEEDIDEIATILRLRSEVIELHTGFSLAGRLSDLTGTKDKAPAPHGANTRTFRQR